MKYIVHFLTSKPTQPGHTWEEGVCRNAVEDAPNKEEAVRLASQRPIFGEVIMVRARHNNDWGALRKVMLKKYGHHRGSSMKQRDKLIIVAAGICAAVTVFTTITTVYYFFA